MGDRLTEENPTQTGPQSYGDIFDRLLPEYMAIGMTYDEYWDGEFGTKRAARKAFEIRIKNEQMMADRQNWYMGQYLMFVLRATPLLVGGLNVKATTRLPEYPEKPFYEQYEEQKKEEVRKKKEEEQAKLAMAMMHAMFNKFNKRFEERKAAEQKTVKAGK